MSLTAAVMFKTSRALAVWIVIAASTLTLPLAAANAFCPIALPGERLFPENVSITPDGTAFVGSAYGGVLRVSLRTGRVDTWLEPAAHGTGSIYGVLADVRHRMLWVCSNDLSARNVVVVGADPGSALKGFDLRTGRQRVSLALPGPAPICNDIAVADDGSVYVTDTGASQVLRWQPGADALEVWTSDAVLQAPAGGGLDGIAFGRDGQLYLNNVRSGELFRVTTAADGSAATISKLTLSRPLVRPDGMRMISSTELVLAEGDGRIDQLTIDGDHVHVRTLAEGISEPTGVDVYSGTIWYVQGQLSYLLQPEAAQGSPALPFQLTPLRVGQ